MDHQLQWEPFLTGPPNQLAKVLADMDVLVFNEEMSKMEAAPYDEVDPDVRDVYQHELSNKVALARWWRQEEQRRLQAKFHALGYGPPPLPLGSPEPKPLLQHDTAKDQQGASSREDLGHAGGSARTAGPCVAFVHAHARVLDDAPLLLRAPDGPTRIMHALNNTTVLLLARRPRTTLPQGLRHHRTTAAAATTPLPAAAPAAACHGPCGPQVGTGSDLPHSAGQCALHRRQGPCCTACAAAPSWPLYVPYVPLPQLLFPRALPCPDPAPTLLHRVVCHSVRDTRRGHRGGSPPAASCNHDCAGRRSTGWPPVCRGRPSPRVPRASAYQLMITACKEHPARGRVHCQQAVCGPQAAGAVVGCRMPRVFLQEQRNKLGQLPRVALLVRKY